MSSLGFGRLLILLRVGSFEVELVILLSPVVVVLLDSAQMLFLNTQSQEAVGKSQHEHSVGLSASPLAQLLALRLYQFCMFQRTDDDGGGDSHVGTGTGTELLTSCRTYTTPTTAN